MKQAVTELADGRELIYFDSADDQVRDAVDRRTLPPVSASSELRYDPLLDEWTAIATHRQGRTFLPPAAECPLCPSTPGNLTEVPAESYEVVVFENRFPSLSLGAAAPPHVAGVAADTGFVRQRAGTGRCEVVCFTDDHDASFSELSTDRARLVVEAWAERTAALNALPEVAQVFCFENRGVEIGVTLHHPHGQIYGCPFVTPRTRQMLENARRYRHRTSRDLFADVLAAEQVAGVRVVTRTEHFTAFVPAAARWPFEVHLYPHRRVPDLPALTDAERDDLATVYRDLLRRFERMMESPMPYIAAWHQAPAETDRDLAYLHLELFSMRREAGKLKYLAGTESGMGVFINDIAPERAAELLRAAAD